MIAFPQHEELDDADADVHERQPPDVAFDHGAAVPVAYPVGIAEQDASLSPEQRTKRRIAAATLRVLCGFYAGSRSQLARELGISRQALSVSVARTAKFFPAGLRSRLFLFPDEHRARLAEAAAAAWPKRRKKKAASGSPTVAATPKHLEHTPAK